MSSVSRGFATRLTKSFVANGNVNGNAGNFTGGAYLTTFGAMIPVLAFFNPTYDQPFVGLKCKFVSFGSRGDLVAALSQVWENTTITTVPYETLIDMGREIKFGVAGGESDLVTFRVVQRTNGDANTRGVGGVPSYGVGNDVGYNTFLVPVENRLSGYDLNGVFPVQVSRQ
jgi:hypothetical protein